MKTLLFGASSLMLITLSACGGPSAALPASSNAPLAPVPAGYAGKTNPLGADAVAAGAEVYATYCEMCHGTEGHGDGSAGTSLIPRPKNLPELAQAAGDDYLYWRISEGKPGTAMPPWKGILREDQIWQLVSYIRTLK